MKKCLSFVTGTIIFCFLTCINPLRGCLHLQENMEMGIKNKSKNPIEIMSPSDSMLVFVRVLKWYIVTTT